MAFYQSSRTREHSQPPSTEADNPRYESNDDKTPKAGNKRLFSNRESRQIEAPYTDYNEAPLPSSEAQPRRHSDKRHRNEDWPLPSSPSSPSSARPPLRSRNAPNSPASHHRRRATSQQRPSKFLEGSMNDRISAVPPTPYLDGIDSDLLSEYDPIEPSRGRKIARPRKFTSKRNASIAGGASVSSQTESRHSIFKFGKSIAATFNPSNWKIWGKDKQVQDEETAQMRELRERQSKAERIYRELKESGQFRGSAIVFPNPGLQMRSEEQQQENKNPKHDSGVEFGGGVESARNSREMSMDEKRKGRVYLEPPNLSTGGSTYEGSPVSHISSSQAHSNPSSPNKPSFHFNKPSLSNLKKSLASISSTNVSEPGPVRRIPSRKDLQKQQKLVKRVSDLEGKLQAARKQLSDALGEPLPASQVSLSSQASSQVLDEFVTPPVPAHTHQRPVERVVRKPFVPGALASLPSERLLAGYCEDGEDDGEEEKGMEIGMAVTVDHPQQSDEKPKKSGLKNTQSPAWLGRQLHGPGSLSMDYPMQGVETEDTTPTVKKSFKSTKSDVATTITSISEPTTRDSDPNDSDYAEGEVEEEEDELENEVVDENENEDKEKTPKPQPKRSPPSKKRKSSDDGGVYKLDEEESEPEFEVKKSTPRKNGSSVNSTPRSSKSQGHKLILKHPRKLQKISPTQAKDPNISALPTRAPPPPPAEGPQPPTRAPPPPPIDDTKSETSQTSTQKHPSRTSSLKPTLKSPPPSNCLSKPPPMPQLAAPPPSSPFTGIGPDLEYKKPSLQRQDHEYSADPHQDAGVPPMPEMPKAIRLISGEVIETTASKFVVSGSGSIRNGDPRKKNGGGSTVSKVSKASNANTGVKLAKERRESKRLEKKREAAGAGEVSEKKSFEWPDDVF